MPSCVVLLSSSLALAEARALEGAIDVPGPPGSSAFGERVLVLPNGNLVVIDSEYGLTASRQGAVHLYDGESLAPISTLTGSSTNDRVGFDGVLVLANGNFVVRSSFWDDVENSRADAGAATFCSAVTGCAGEVSAANSLVGASVNDLVGRAARALPNGDYVVGSEFWDRPEPPTANVGAATLCNGATGCSGPVGVGNSLVGSSVDDRIGANLLALPNGGSLVWSNAWDAPGPPAVANVGAVVHCPLTGCTGVVSAANALVGGTAQDAIGPPVVLTNGHYVVGSTSWDHPSLAVADAGAATFCNGAGGCTGLVTTANSLVGTSANDRVGAYVIPLTNGNDVVGAPSWDDSATANVGAITWCSGVTGCIGVVEPANSLIGATASDLVGTVSPGTIALAGGGYAVMSPFWDKTDPLVADVGAVTRCPATAGGCAGMVVSAANSLVGSSAIDTVADIPSTARSRSRPARTSC